MRKTAQLVQEHTGAYFAGKPGDEFRHTAQTLERLANEEEPETVKVFNLIKAFHNLTANGHDEAPYLIPIGEQAEHIAEAFKERQATTQETLEQLTELVGEQKEAERAWREMNLSPDGFAVFWSLKREGVKGAEEAARQVAAALEDHPHWQRSEKGEREVRRALYKALLGARAERITELAEHLMSTLRKASS